SSSPVVSSSGSSVDPDYLKLLKPPVPVHEGLINVQLKGYDFPVLERQARRVLKLVSKLNLTLSEAWPTPLRSFRVQTFKPQSTTVDKSYDLPIYERNVQIAMVPGFLLGTFIDLVQKNLAVGVTVNIHLHGPEHLEIRQIPDLELEALERQLEELTGTPINPHQKKL
ncbi:uncharacterized protein LOC100909376, partial [Galendromus occidentalis]|uniref:Uncharacterized protein LOC100909376 n=1 Tax=Galendromus occidentalis TaxID=34638 RepID=A0AAJ6QVZ3_9ACAR